MADAIRHRVYTIAGESWEGGDTTKCPGEANCDDWAQQFDGDHETKETAICHGCPMFASKPNSLDQHQDNFSAEEIDDFVADIESIVDWEDAGFETDWSLYPFEICQLAVTWRNAEAEIARQHERNFQALIKGFLK